MECNICGENVEGIATGLITIIEVEPDGYVNVDDEVGGAMHDKCYANFERSARVAPELLEALEALVDIVEDDHYKCDIDSDEECNMGWEDGEWQIRYHHGAVRQAKQAIARAKDESKEPEGYQLESVGTYIRADGWCFPMLASGGYRDDDLVAVHIRDCDPEDEGHEWWQRLSPADRKIVEAVKAEVSR